MFEVFLGVTLFTVIVLALVLLIQLARHLLVPSGSVSIDVNGKKQFELPVGGKLLNSLADADIFVSSACGGGGTCAQCKVQIICLVIDAIPKSIDL